MDKETAVWAMVISGNTALFFTPDISHQNFVLIANLFTIWIAWAGLNTYKPQ